MTNQTIQKIWYGVYVEEKTQTQNSRSRHASCWTRLKGCVGKESAIENDGWKLRRG
jgi:hypothetical protein